MSHKTKVSLSCLSCIPRAGPDNQDARPWPSGRPWSLGVRFGLCSSNAGENAEDRSHSFVWIEQFAAAAGDGREGQAAREKTVGFLKYVWQRLLMARRGPLERRCLTVKNIHTRKLAVSQSTYVPIYIGNNCRELTSFHGWGFLVAAVRMLWDRSGGQQTMDQ